MNIYIFQVAGDLLHLLAISVLLWRIIKTKSCEGISARTQILLAMVLSTRYLPALNCCSMYSTVMKIIYLIAVYTTVLLILASCRQTCENKKDVFLTEFLVVPCFVLAVFFNYARTPSEILWAFSIFLESVAILPQFYMILKAKQVEKVLLYYLALFGLYRSLYVVKWLIRYMSTGEYDIISDAGGLIHVFIYILGIATLLFGTIEVTKDGPGHFLRSNIFFTSNSSRPLNDPSNFSLTQADNKQNKSCSMQYERV